MGYVPIYDDRPTPPPRVNLSRYDFRISGVPHAERPRMKHPINFDRVVGIVHVTVWAALVLYMIFVIIGSVWADCRTPISEFFDVEAADPCITASETVSSPRRIDVEETKLPAHLVEAIELEPLKTMVARGGSWAVYRNEDMGHPDLGRLTFLAYGEGKTFKTPPVSYPSDAGDIGPGWRYMLKGVMTETELTELHRKRTEFTGKKKGN